MSAKTIVDPDEVLNKEFLSQFLKQLHAQVSEKVLERERDVHLGFEIDSFAGNNSGNSHNGAYLCVGLKENSKRKSLVCGSVNLRVLPSG